MTTESEIAIEVESPKVGKMETKYKVVKIQDLAPIEGAHFSSPMRSTAEAWKSLKCTHPEGKCKCNILYSTENVTSNVQCSSNSFYGAFVSAYNNHEDIVLSPDDVWMMICFQLSKEIHLSAEKIRDKFVSHSDKKKLSVVTRGETSESQWDEFFGLVIGEIKKNTKEGVVDLLKSNFTTTGQVESILSVALIMDSFKEYFSYHRFIPGCGIKNARFMGTLSDWESLLEKTMKLEEYAVSDSWKRYVKELQPILVQFIKTYKGDVDVDFWDKVMNFTRGRLGSGGTTMVSGWILKFFGLNGPVDTVKIPRFSLDVPVEIINKLTGEKKMVNLVGGFGGVHNEDGAYRPQLSMIVFHGVETTE